MFFSGFGQGDEVGEATTVIRKHQILMQKARREKRAPFLLP